MLQGQDYVALPTVNCPKPQMKLEDNPFRDHKDMLMVVIKPIDDDSIPVETIPDEHDGSDVTKLKRPDLPEEIVAILDEYKMYLQRIYH